MWQASAGWLVGRCTVSRLADLQAGQACNQACLVSLLFAGRQGSGAAGRVKSGLVVFSCSGHIEQVACRRLGKSITMANLIGLRPHAADLRKIFFQLFFQFFFDPFWPYLAILDRFGGPEKNRSKVTSKKSGALTGRTIDSDLSQKNGPQSFQKKLEQKTFEFYVISWYDMIWYDMTWYIW